MRKIIVLLTTSLFLVFANLSFAAEQKKIEDVSHSALQAELIASQSKVDKFQYIQWIPFEYWQVILNEEKSMTAEGKQKLLEQLQPYFMLAVVDGRVETLGSMKFTPVEELRKNIEVIYIDKDQIVNKLSAEQNPGSEMNLFIKMMKPVLSQMVGEIGQNMEFFVFKDPTEKRLVSPYKPGKLQVKVNGAASNPLEIQLPLDSLFVPRKCPNGKPAHVSWNYCPWSGKKLK